MKTSITFNDFNTIQKIGFVLIILAGGMTLLKMLNLIKINHSTEEDLPNYLFLLGGFLMLLPLFLKRMKIHNPPKKASFILIVLSASLSATAQDYSKQIAAFEQSFTEKSVAPLNPYLSPTLKFDPISVANKPAILNNIVSYLPKLNSMSILQSSEGKAKIKYDFEGLGIRESHIYFDAEGKFTRIELIENLIKMEIEAQKKKKESVQLPRPGPIGKKYQPRKVEFEAADGLLVNGNLYENETDKPSILLCHQAGYNSIEYSDIAPKLNELGYNCLAIDQRSGGNFAGKKNISASRAEESKLKNEMIDAQMDIKAAIDFLYLKYKKKIILWGSSYSSSLALLEGISNNKVKAIVAFSPGDYFGEAAPSLGSVFARVDKPFLVTSSKEESTALKLLIGNIKLNKNQSQFIPESEGFHGSKALLTGQKGAYEYWKAIATFLASIE